MTEEAIQQQDGNRATVALALAEIRALKDLTRAENGATRELLAPLLGLPVTVAVIRGDIDGLRRRVEELEREEFSKGEWRRGPLLSVVVVGLIGLATLIVAILQITNGAGHA